MTLKELIRSAITGEMGDISGCEADAAAFPGPAAEFFLKLAAEKRERLKELGRLLKEGIGFRQREDKISKSLEAALRARAARASEAASVYAALSRQLSRPETREAMKAFAEREMEILSVIRGLQSPSKK